MSTLYIYQSRIYRADLQANPNVLYVFGDNTRRMGYGGQAKEMRGEPNAVGVCTKWGPSNYKTDYFTDSDFSEVVKIIERDLQRVSDQFEAGGNVIAPLDGIGTGLSELPTRAPRIYAYVCSLGLGAQT